MLLNFCYIYCTLTHLMYFKAQASLNRQFHLGEAGSWWLGQLGQQWFSLAGSTVCLNWVNIDYEYWI